MAPLLLQAHLLPCYHFDLILGEDWCETISCQISFKTHSLKCDDTDGRCHTLLTQATDGPTLCPIVSAIHLEQSLQQDDSAYFDYGKKYVVASQKLHPPQPAALGAMQACKVVSKGAGAMWLLVS